MAQNITARLRRSPLRPDLHRAWEALDKMPAGTTVIDRDGWRWHVDGMGYWHNDFEPVRSSFQLAQLAPITEETA